LEIGELVLQQLKLLSEVAYVRFASVYRQFRSIRDFVETLEELSGQIEKEAETDSPNDSDPSQSAYEFTHS
jgi:transcriptional repressor NrdR